MTTSERSVQGTPCAPSVTGFNPPADVLEFLSSPRAYPHRPAAVEVRETHMSWVFLTGSLVYKLKKPVCRPLRDLSPPANLRHNCEEELRLNRRSDGHVSLRMLPLRVDQRCKHTLE